MRYVAELPLIVSPLVNSRLKYPFRNSGRVQAIRSAFILQHYLIFEIPISLKILFSGEQRLGWCVQIPYDGVFGNDGHFLEVS